MKKVYTLGSPNLYWLPSNIQKLLIVEGNTSIPKKRRIQKGKGKGKRIDEDKEIHITLT